MKVKRMVTMLRPDYKRVIIRGIPQQPLLSDYITVPWIDTLPTRKVVELLDMETLTKLAILREKLGATHHAGTISERVPSQSRRKKFNGQAAKAFKA